MSHNLLSLLEKQLPNNYHYLDIPLFHVSKENFSFPQIDFINSQFKNNDHHIKSAMGLWTCNNDLIMSDIDNKLFQYQCIMKPDTKWSFFSHSNFKKIFQLIEEHAHKYKLTEDEFNTKVFNIYQEIRKKYDVLILASNIEPEIQDIVDTKSIQQCLLHKKEEIIILNLNMISEWNLINKKHKLTP